MKDLLPLKEAIYEVGLLFSKPSQPTEAQINAYARALQNYTPKQVTHAFNQVILVDSQAHFPSLAELLGHLRPKEVTSREIGNQVANEVIQKVIDFGFYRLTEAFEALSDMSKKTIGGNRYILNEIANSDKDQLTSIRAQIRDMAAAASEQYKADKANAKLESIGITAGRVLDFPKSEFKTIDYSNFLPNGSEDK